ncbi:MAG TPA: hypothetical protein VL728_01055 [Cyclobacteriaceae bacterium]|jgi:hypothetical protein|nr:hypothetical protein [Cyclobacteriaceae bacterium]
MAKTATKKPAKPKSLGSIVTTSETVLQKLESLNLNPRLQSEIQWCLGSFKHDQNPVGLLEKLSEAVALLKVEHAKKTKGITAKLIGDVEKALAS